MNVFMQDLTPTFRTNAQMNIMKRWICTLLAVVLTVIIARQIPVAYDGIKNTRQLRENGRTITGRVTAHGTLPAGKGCRDQADIGYTVAGSTYTARITGCGASPHNLPVGREVDVRYLPFSPSISQVTVPGADTPTHDWTSLLLVFGSQVLLLIAVGKMWMKRAPVTKNNQK